MGKSDKQDSTIIELKLNLRLYPIKAGLVAILIVDLFLIATAIGCMFNGSGGTYLMLWITISIMIVDLILMIVCDNVMLTTKSNKNVLIINNEKTKMIVKKRNKYDEYNLDDIVLNYITFVVYTFDKFNALYIQNKNSNYLTTVYITKKQGKIIEKYLSQEIFERFKWC